MPKVTKESYKKEYTKPALRKRLKEAIQSGIKRDKAHQWSARKAQFLKQAYESQGGGYKHRGKKTEQQKSLSQWTKENRQTSDNKSAIRDKKTTRYVPKKVGRH